MTTALARRIARAARDRPTGTWSGMTVRRKVIPLQVPVSIDASASLERQSQCCTTAHLDSCPQKANLTFAVNS